MHAGGVVGSSAGTLRPVADLSVWDDAPRMHEGGIAGNERRAVLEVGEEVVRADNPRHIRNYEGATRAVDAQVKVNVITPPGVQVERQEQRQGIDGRELDIVLRMAEERVAAGIASGSGPGARALKSRGVNLSGNLARSGR